MNQSEIVASIINLVLFGLVVWLAIVWAFPLVKSGDWFGVALIGVVVGAVWQVVKSGGGE